jgi:hypothetical protein
MKLSHGANLVAQAIMSILNNLQRLSKVMNGHCQKRSLELAHMPCLVAVVRVLI